MEYCEIIRCHYERQWSNSAKRRSWTEGPTHQLPPRFCVLEFPPVKSRRNWTYATCCMSQQDDDEPIELHLFSYVQERSLVELLTAVAHYNRTGSRLGLGHTVNFGRPWLPRSECSHGLISLPYLDGPSLEICDSQLITKPVRCLWLIPVTAREVEYAKKNGIESLEQRFEENEFNYIDPKRESIV